ncbi:MAG: glycosyl transferase group 1 [Myxococcaceae bacterium]|nr:glycosyl transferase group 1 [Myxococcaceae bacterium]
MKTLLLIPSVAKSGLGAAVAADKHPTMDYEALAAALRSRPGGHADLLDYAAVDRETDPAVRWVRKVAGRNAALALMGFQRRNDYAAIFTNAENVALPLALLLKTVSKRPRHVTIAHRLSAKKKQVFYRLLQVHRQMDAIFLYASTQLEYAREQLGIPDESLRLIQFHVDHRFYRPLGDTEVREEQICAAGLEWRDYPTLIDAVTEKTDLSVRLAAASPWSRGANETEARELPAHVDARRYDYHALRDLYAESAVVVVPLYENDFQAGITTILEAMAMAKPVIVTRTAGQCDVVADGHTGIYVAPGGVEDWKQAIDRVRNDPALRANLGQRARRWVEENATLDVWVNNIVGAIHNAPAVVEANAPQQLASVTASSSRRRSAWPAGLAQGSQASEHIEPGHRLMNGTYSA